GPRVDLVLEITNTTDKDVTIWVGGDETALTFELKGPGAVNKVITLATTADIKISRAVVIPAGKTYTRPVTGFDYPWPRPQSRWYWTSPGDYTLSATWQLGGPNGAAGPLLVAAPVKLKVTPPAKIKALNVQVQAPGLEMHLTLKENTYV